ncbi:MAG TPA: MMPL family transporter [Actinomycetota bacterium]|jgi:RND superfamily putative drug exporter|nr:MMPL family transporter [Actinomycetota bacterium]
MRINPESVARASSRHPGRTVTVWFLVLVAGIAAAATLLGPALTTDFDFTNVPEAKRAQLLLEERQLEEDIVTETFVVTTESEAGVEDPAFADEVNRLLSDLQALGPGVVSSVPEAFPMSDEAAADPRVAALGPIPSEDGGAVLFTAVLAGEIDDASAHALEIDAVREAHSGDGIETFQLGQVSSSEDFKRISEEDLRFGEGIGVLAAIIVLIVVFGAVVAGVTPIVMGIFSIAVTLGIVGLFGTVWNFSFFTPNLISMMGLAVGIDYSLFIVSRYREERSKGREKLDAIAMSGATANRAVFFSGLTVVLALAGMLLVPTTIFRSLAGGAIIVVLVSVAASMTLLPAILAMLGDKINAGRIFGRNRSIEHGRAGGFWDRVTRGVMGRPVVWLVLAGGLLVVLSLPYWLQGHPEDDGQGIKTGLAGIETLPDDTQSKQAYQTIVERFPEAGAQASVKIVVVGDGAVGAPGPEPGAPGELEPEIASSVGAFTDSIADDATLGEPLPPQVSQDGSLAVVEVPLTGAAVDGQSEAAVATVTRLRETYVPDAFDDSGAQEVLVGGDTAFVKDFFDISDSYTPLIVLLVLALSFVLLTIVFRSLVVPAKAIVMNLLSVGAAYGLIVLVFQKGGPVIGEWIASLFGFEQVDAIEAWLPLFLFSILFGLSMDYHVFLLSRIREEYDKTHDNAEAVAYGLRTTGGIITGAAIIMVAVFAGFAAGRLTSLEQMGFGLAVAVFMDATIVRSILVPSTMRLLGDRNWYLPKWLEWLPKVDVEGHASAEGTVLVPDTPAELVDAEVRE